MSLSLKILLFGCVAVVGFDALASVLSMSIGFEYAKASVGSFLIYAVVGIFAARAKGPWLSVGIGAVLGLTDVTIGWAVAWAIGPGRSPSGAITVPEWAVAAVVVIGIATVCAGVGGLIGNLSRSSVARRHRIKG